MRVHTASQVEGTDGGHATTALWRYDVRASRCDVSSGAIGRVSSILMSRAAEACGLLS